MARLTSREYTPTEADIGHKLKVEAVSLDTNRVALSAETRAVIDRTAAAEGHP